MIYLASPYSHPDAAVREIRFLKACRAAAQLMNKGHLIFSPIAHSHPIALCGLPLDFAYWERFNREMLTFCESMMVLMLDGWQLSTGVQAEIRIMRGLDRPINYLLEE